MSLEKIYLCSVEVRGYELDSYGHVNHAVYVSYLEHARWKMLQEIGVTLKNFSDWKRWPVIASLEVKYLKPVFMGDELQIRSKMIENQRASFVYEQNIFKGDLHVLTGKVRIVIINEAGRPSELPDDIRRLWTNQV